MVEDKQTSKVTYLLYPFVKVYRALKWLVSLPLQLIIIIFSIPTKYLFKPIYSFVGNTYINLKKTRIVLRGVWGKRFGYLPLVIIMWATFVTIFLWGAAGLLGDLDFFSKDNKPHHYLLDSCRNNDIR